MGAARGVAKKGGGLAAPERASLVYLMKTNLFLFESRACWFDEKDLFTLTFKLKGFAVIVK